MGSPGKGPQLVIVESPAKARTIGRILGDSYLVKASRGHVRDLPRGFFGVDIKRDFKPKYEVPKEKRPILDEIRQAAEKAMAIYLATDPDREGEAISWHVLQATRLDHSPPVHRVVFHEITEKAVKEAFRHPRDIDLRLVDAQQARRILDRLVGYKLSPLLWRKVQGGLSAGRVQSAALRLVVDREAEVASFVPEEYWSIEAQLRKAADPASPAFTALLVNRLGKKQKLRVPDEEHAQGILQELQGAHYTVEELRQRDVARRPAPPFITSTLQQEAWRALHFSAKKTMLLAQQLYEGVPLGGQGSVGLITYMRTDSTHVAPSAIAETRGYVAETYGQAFLPPSPRVFSRKVKGAQEAHEAIRPTAVSRKPESVRGHLTREQLALYTLIWKRMVASQMADASFTNTAVDIAARAPKASYLFRASGSVLKFQGFLVLYSERRDEDSTEEEAKGILPALKKGERLACLALTPRQHFTQPPPRYTEATLIKALEEKGIGRPSTYAPIVSTIQDRSYVEKIDGHLHPTKLGTTVHELLVNNFANIVDLDFTARMEAELDEIATGQREWVPFLRAFYEPFEQSVQEASQRIAKVPQEPTGEVCERCGKPMVLRWSRFGKFLGCSGFPECRNIRRIVATTGARCPKCGGDLVERRAKKGRKRPFYGCSRWPECDFLVNQKPLPEPCPQCQKLLVQAGKNRVKCTSCDYVGKAREPGAAPSPAEPGPVSDVDTAEES